MKKQHEVCSSLGVFVLLFVCLGDFFGLVWLVLGFFCVFFFGFGTFVCLFRVAFFVVVFVLGWFFFGGWGSFWVWGFF